MIRLEFMQKLESLLSDISPSEREEALQYYNDYLNDAGIESEQDVLESLGTPEKVAKTIKDGLNDGNTNGEYTETGYKDKTYYEDRKEVLNKSGKKSLSGGMIVLIVILCVFGFPLVIGGVTGLFGGLIGLVFGIIGIIIGIAAAGFALFAAGIAVTGIGIGFLFTSPVGGVCLIGAGLLILGVSLFFIWLTVCFFGKAVPSIIKLIVDLCSRLFRRKGGEKI